MGWGRAVFEGGEGVGGLEGKEGFSISVEIGYRGYVVLRRLVFSVFLAFFWEF